MQMSKREHYFYGFFPLQREGGLNLLAQLLLHKRNSN